MGRSPTKAQSGPNIIRILHHTLDSKRSCPSPQRGNVGRGEMPLCQPLLPLAPVTLDKNSPIRIDDFQRIEIMKEFDDVMKKTEERDDD
jgi:hypothetical protein